MNSRSLGHDYTNIVNQSVEQMAQIEQQKLELKQKDCILLKAKEAIETLQQQNSNHILLPIKEPEKIYIYKDTNDVGVQAIEEEKTLLPIQNEIPNVDLVNKLEKLEQRNKELVDKLERMTNRYNELGKRKDEKAKQVKMALQELEKTRASALAEQHNHNKCIEQFTDANQKITHLQKSLQTSSVNLQKETELRIIADKQVIHLKQQLEETKSSNQAEIASLQRQPQEKSIKSPDKENINPGLFTVERLAQSNQILIQELEHKRKLLEKLNSKYKVLKAEVSTNLYHSNTLQNASNKVLVKKYKHIMTDHEITTQRDERTKRLVEQIDQHINRYSKSPTHVKE
jgi:hypothetical protein